MRRLGQHFLINKRKIGGTVEALELKNGDTYNLTANYVEKDINELTNGNRRGFHL